MTRDELIALCEAAIVPESKWLDRDSCDAQQGIGKAWALLKGGCDYVIEEVTETRIWIMIAPTGFQTFELGDEGRPMDEFMVRIPTARALNACNADGDVCDWLAL